MPGKDFETLTIGIISDIHHWRDDEGRLCSFGPYVREMDIWSRIFGKTIVTAGKGRGPMPNHSLPYADQNIEFIPLYHAAGSSRTARLNRILHIPSILVAVLRIIKRSDVIHLRTPSFSCLIAMIALLFSRKPRIAKWATSFAPVRNEPLTGMLQRLFLKAGWLNGPVMVYGEYEKPDLVPFFPAAMTAAELDAMWIAAQGKRFAPPWRMVIIGRMTDGKGFELGLQSLAYMKKNHPETLWQAKMIGEGPCMERLIDLCLDLGIDKDVEFTGGKTFEEVLGYYASAHVLLMPGQMEGFPKVLIEACASRTIPVAADAGISSWILGDGNRGILAPPDPESLGSALVRAVSLTEAERASMFEAGRKWVESLTLEKFEERLISVLENLMAS